MVKIKRRGLGVTVWRRHHRTNPRFNDKGKIFLRYHKK